jgi:hypothetical protein
MKTFVGMEFKKRENPEKSQVKLRLSSPQISLCHYRDSNCGP